MIRNKILEKMTNIYYGSLADALKKSSENEIL